MASWKLPEATFGPGPGNALKWLPGATFVPGLGIVPRPRNPGGFLKRLLSMGLDSLRHNLHHELSYQEVDGHFEAAEIQN